MRDYERQREQAAKNAQQRNDYLIEVFNDSDGRADVFVDESVMAADFLLDADEAKAVRRFLLNEQLIVTRGRLVALTHAGLVRVERLLRTVSATNWEKARERALALQEERLGVLVTLYEAFEGDERRNTTWADLMSRAGLDDANLTRVWTYLRFEELVGGEKNSRVQLTHKGLLELERALTREEATDHFPAPVIMTFNAAVGAVQHGQGSTSNVKQG